MFTPDMEFSRGLSALRIELWTVLCADAPQGWLRSDAVHGSQVGGPGSGRGSDRSSGPGSGRGSGSPRSRGDDAAAEEHAEADRLVALVDLAREGDAEAFGLLYDHYHASIYRFVYYRV